MTLKEMRAQIPQGKWAHSRIYEDIKVAIEVGHAADFWELPKDIQSYLLAVYRTEGIKQAYEKKLDDDEARRNKKGTKRGG